ncbi:4-hydroxyphenylacetate 3-hydroxylase family protein [Conexibacter woesei]|uniref:4-hydroxyphenylacetate 3-hydroxylase n=1 Tax=Conexibacter woesei (strain DSM 14684 / CCUG 47730 / CIP 108061 / JCM 11494 / NBRC 100937 / ID131577) TaxID=469383 RepID=D3F6Y1_CONWI|nr:4-hydroxyphenylacetate 3-hydroxylase N-terminal domain-containing protein [Conexibacter woesei]ADB52779.1 4-hydroxyphenylacetate 3-hydroxylase [Conexibacter woesei DSM 14684]
MRSGSDYLAAIDDGRRVYVDGEAVEDVASHRAFRGVVETIGGLYDFAADPANEMSYVAPETGRPALKPFMTPRSREELADRRAAIAKWAGLTHGFVGRSPDHVAGFLAGFASDPSVFDVEDGRQLGANVTRWYAKLLDESPFISYVIIPPQVSRAMTASGCDGDYVQAGVVEETDEGIVVRGSQMLGTGTAVSDYLFVSCIKPLTADDVDHAISFVVPVGAPGVKVYCRRPYALGATSSFDYPLSTRFDESDALLVFDDVLIPWEDVFVCRDVDRVRDQFFRTPAHVLGNSQAQIRFVAKLSFLLGLARRICAVNQIDRIPSVTERLADLASLAALVEGMVVASEASAVENARGVVQPNPRFLYGAMGMQAEIYPRFLHIMRELVGGGVIQLPSSYKELVNEDTAPDFARYLVSPGMQSEQRVQLFKLAWDAIGSEFAGRHHQYEMFYAGAPFVAKGYAYRNYGFDDALAAVDGFLARYSLADAVAEEERVHEQA